MGRTRPDGSNIWIFTSVNRLLLWLVEITHMGVRTRTNLAFNNIDEIETVLLSSVLLNFKLPKRLTVSDLLIILDSDSKGYKIGPKSFP